MPASDLFLDPAAQIFRSLAVARCLGTVARLGILSELATSPATVEQLALRISVERLPLRLMLDVLVDERLLELTGAGYSIAPAARAQLDPDSPTSVTTLLSGLLDQWNLWGDLEFVAAGGRSPGGTPAVDDEVGWLRRVRGQYEYARRTGGWLLDGITLPERARSIVDVGGNHGWYAAELCRHNPGVRATVVDSAPAIAIGREIIWEAGLERTVTHRAGDIFTADLGGPHDAAICLPLVYGLRDPQALPLLRRIRAALRPGGLLLIPRLNHRAQRCGTSFAVPAAELFLHLDSGVEPTTMAQLCEQLAAAGFSAPTIQDAPVGAELCLCVATAI